jgi:hypothetical protein
VSKKPERYEEELEALMFALAESVAESSDEEILEEIREQGEDPRAAANRVRNVLFTAAKDYQQRHLHEAQRQHEQNVSAMKEKTYDLPLSADERRILLDRVFSLQPAMRSAILTAQHRDFKSLTDADIESYLKQLKELGALDDPSRIEKEEK